ncbi:hypothetical protein Lal_00002241 [Lupinus albus]|uniref:Probable purine permease n=1 Tax=Lupinus albus TaxID=3870 RepID=A0A6A5P9T1_LUPAL|nr:putative purine permease, plant [Lupinus albus]KAF1893722.1 hypothetical protein Lal_00002241 [Lupinus albus]
MIEGREAEQNKTMKRTLLIMNCIMQALGFSCGPLLTRLYFLNGGNLVWLSCFLQTATFPIILLPLSISYLHRTRNHNLTERIKPKMFSIKPPLFVAFAIIGVFSGLNSYLYSTGVATLPVSTSTIIIATQLVFIAIFSFILVSQKFTPYSVNAIVLLTIGLGIMGLHTHEDLPENEAPKQYVLGFVMTVVSAAVGGFILPMMELMFKKTKQAITYSLMLEIQFIVCFFATLACTFGMIISNDFKAIPVEARNFELGETNYYGVLVLISIIWQIYYMGSMGVTICSSSLLSGIITALMMPITEILAIIFYEENFNAEKGVSLVLSLWGFVSYFYGEFKQAKLVKWMHIPEIQHHLNPSFHN